MEIEEIKERMKEKFKEKYLNCRFEDIEEDRAKLKVVFGKRKFAIVDFTKLQSEINNNPPHSWDDIFNMWVKNMEIKLEPFDIFGFTLKFKDREVIESIENEKCRILKFDDFIVNGTSPIVVKDEENRFVYVTEKMAKEWNISASELKRVAMLNYLLDGVLMCIERVFLDFGFSAKLLFTEKNINKNKVRRDFFTNKKISFPILFPEDITEDFLDEVIFKLKEIPLPPNFDLNVSVLPKTEKVKPILIEVSLK